MKTIGFIVAIAFAWAPVYAQGPVVVQPSPAQAKQLASVLDSADVPAALRPAWKQAQPNITRVLLYLGCYPGWDAWKYLKSYQIPGVTGDTYYLSPMNATRYHDNTQCLTIRRIRSVQQQSDTAFSFRVLFVADDSNESADRTFGMVRQADGSWLFARGGF
jgi:hypothetical protein